MKEAPAWAWARDIEAQIDAGTLRATIAGKDTIGQLIEKCRNLRAKTRPVLDTSTEHYTLKQLTVSGHSTASFSSSLERSKPMHFTTRMQWVSD